MMKMFPQNYTFIQFLEDIVHETSKKLLIDHFNFLNLCKDYSHYKFNMKREPQYSVVSMGRHAQFLSFLIVAGVSVKLTDVQFHICKTL